MGGGYTTGGPVQESCAAGRAIWTSMPTMRIAITMLGLALLTGCSGPDHRPTVDLDMREVFPDLIDYHGLPSVTEDWAPMPFADNGAWFGFAIPPHEADVPAAGFVGPFLMTSGRWLSPQLARLDCPGAASVETIGLPGALVQVWQSDSLQVAQALWFHSSSTAVVESRLYNRSNQRRIVDLVWTGDVFAGAATLEVVGSDVVAVTPSGDRIRLTADRTVTGVEIDGDSYRMLLAGAMMLTPGDSATVTLAITMTIAGDPEVDPAPALADPMASLSANTARWNGYLDATAAAGAPDDPRRILAVKAVQTLMGNWRGPAGRFPHGGLFPSSNVWYFNGFWAWDSWKHAVALARFAPDVAADQLRLMAGQQDDQGMIADVVYLDAGEDNWRDTKPPLLGWALVEVYEATGDVDLVRELYPGLVRYHEWWYANRDHDRDGLCEYGSTDGTIVAARWESGMDNAVRFDHTEMLQNGPQAWSMNQESVDLNSYLYREKVALADMAAVLGRPQDIQRWASEAVALRARIQSTLFDDGTGWFHDRAIDGGAFIAAQGPEGWTPLWTGVATEDQAARLRTTMLDPAKFRTRVPFPTVAADDPEFSDGYWRGLVWLDQVGFAIEGLRAYGYHDDADSLAAQVFANLEGATVPGVPLRENYHPLTGEGRNVKHFSWTAAHLLLLALAGR